MYISRNFQETLLSLLSTHWFQERILADFTIKLKYIDGLMED